MTQHEKVLVALDESATAFRALQWAIARAARASDEVWALAVLDTRRVDLAVRAPTKGAAAQETYGARRTHILAQAEQSAAGNGVQPHTEMRPSNDPASAIVAYARAGDFRAIVLGHREKHGVEKVVLGSTALRVLELTHLPVTIVR